jgi:hypothetical protein
MESAFFEGERIGRPLYDGRQHPGREQRPCRSSPGSAGGFTSGQSEQIPESNFHVRCHYFRNGTGPAGKQKNRTQFHARHVSERETG